MPGDPTEFEVFEVACPVVHLPDQRDQPWHGGVIQACSVANREVAIAGEDEVPGAGRVRVGEGEADGLQLCFVAAAGAVAACAGGQGLM